MAKNNVERRLDKLEISVKPDKAVAVMWQGESYCTLGSYRMSVEEFKRRYPDGEIFVIEVVRPGEQSDEMD